MQGLLYPTTGRLSELCRVVLFELDEDAQAGRPVPQNLQQVVGIIVRKGLQDSIFIDVLEVRGGMEVREALVH